MHAKRRRGTPPPSRPYQIFELYPGVENGPPLRLEDVIETYLLARSMDDPRQREACYAMFGLRMDTVERFLPHLVALENGLIQETLYGSMTLGPWSLRLYHGQHRIHLDD